MTFKHLKVKIKGQEMRISALFDRDAPNTLIGYEAAAIHGLKGGQARRLLRTARIKNEGRNGEALGDSPGGNTGPAQLWECVDLVIGRDNQDRRPGTLWAGQGDRREVAL